MIVAHHEKLLTINLFEQTEKTVDCDLYDLKNDTLAIHFGTTLSLYNQKIQLIKSYEVPFSKKVLLSEDGKMCGILSFDKELFIFTKDSQIFHRKDVFSFYISNKYLVLKERGCIKILDVNTFNELKSFTEISFCSLMGEVILLWKSKINEIIIFKDEIIFKQPFDEISKVECKSDDKGNILVLITSKYVSNNYYGHDTLYFFDILSNKLTKLNVEYPPLFYDFKDNKILVVSGYQPSQAYIFNYKLKLIKLFPKGIRNRMFFNKQNTLVAFCGFDNLSGNIEILNIDSLEILTKFKIKGASLFDWSPNGSYFIVSTTNYMKVDNGVVMFDYFGRQVKQKNFGSLVKSEWIGEKEEFVVLKRPEKLLIEKENVYKLPTFDFDDKFSPKKSDKMKKGNGKSIKKENNNALSVNKQRDYEDVKKELEEVKRVKEKREKGENLSVNELNVLLKEAQLLNEIEKYENK